MDFSSIFIIFTIVISRTYSQVCTKRNVCECVFDDGSGYNLKLVVANDSYLEAKSDNITFFFHPCGDTKSLPNINSTIVTNDCEKGYTLCMFNQTASKMEVLGRETTMEFKMNGEAMEMIFAEQSADPKYSVSLECVPKSKNNVLYAPLDIKHDQIRLSLYSKFSCASQIDEIVHHGFFYTFFIILLTLLFVYLFIGILINYFFIGARGYELIPNYDFWRKVWTSAKLGFWYVKNGCRVIPDDDTYDAI